jgi:hypothetical protein
VTISGDEFTLGAGCDLSFVTAPPIISIMGGDGAPLVTIHPNGTLEYGPGYDPDDAARRFWDAMRYHMPARCGRCGHAPGQRAG